jgi:RNA polymerase sigma factor (sigma-70 family)
LSCRATGATVVEDKVLFSASTYQAAHPPLCSSEEADMHTVTAVRPTRRPTMDQPSTVVSWVAAARNGDAEAWNALVEEFLPLVHGVVGRFRLSAADAADVNQTVWLRLVEHLDDLRDARALPGWLATTARREAIRASQAGRRSTSVDPQGAALDALPSDEDVDRVLLRDELQRAVRAGLAELPTQRRRLLEMLMADPPVAYAEISAALDIPIGSIGPTRARALEQLGNTRALRAYADSTDSAAAAGEEGGHHVQIQ